MRIELKFSEDIPIIRLSGKFLAGSDGPFLRQKVNDLIEAGSRKLILDFADVPYIDSTGLGFLAGSQKAAQAAGANVVLASLNPHVRKVLDSVQLTQFFVIAESEAAALAKLKEAPLPAEDPGAAPAKPARVRKRPPTGGA
ncbi:MAG: STAS domain-containing protein [Acidobacteriia bacterium]|nr:STAS domain-containing protein [Terriglobia bacterium]